jgi:hypothetical protein
VGFGDGPTSAFVVTDTRAVFNGLAFTGFANPAVYAVDSYVDFVDCKWNGNFIAGTFADGCSVSVSKCSLTLGTSGTGFILEDSSLTVSKTKFAVGSGTINSFFVCDRTSNLTLDHHSADDETGLTAATPVVYAKLNSTVVCTKDFSSLGKASLISNSVLTRTPKVTPFVGGVSIDSSSMVMTDIS